MIQRSATIRICVGLVGLAVSMLLLIHSFAIAWENPWNAIMRGRRDLCESIAVNCSAVVTDRGTERLERDLAAIVQRNSDLLSAAIRRNGRILVDVGDHRQHWQDADGQQSTDTAMHVPIIQGEDTWGTVELAFRPIHPSGIVGILSNPLIQQLVLFILLSFSSYFLYLRKMLRHLDPSRAIPQRVRAALDTLAEGLLVVDRNERIVLANRAFASKVGEDPQCLMGTRVNDLDWKTTNDDRRSALPWTRTIREGLAQTGSTLKLQLRDEESRTYLVSASPVHGDKGQTQGALISFDDVTQLDKRKSQLRHMVKALEQSGKEIRKQNEELRLLATRDPLTSCLNRRSFFEQFEQYWALARRRERSLSCVMVDVDHFKSINDRHGHSVGDEVLKEVASVLLGCARKPDLVCRYGGEEFAIVLPERSIAEAAVAAEDFRRELAALELPGLSITASFGVSSISCGASDPQSLLDQADMSLYAAKRNGRNQVVRFDEMPTIAESEEAPIPADVSGFEDAADTSIPFHAVTALLSALAYRNPSTAEHSRRVADLCVGVASDIMSGRQTFILEIAALLHDIGKIGVPDAVLLKPGPLTAEEWTIMNVHDRVGVEIVESTFGCNLLVETMKNHQAWYGGNPKRPELPTGKAIPLGARILALADAYDAIVSDHLYRKARSNEEAFAELRRCADTQFDPDLIEPFINSIVSRDDARANDGLIVDKQIALRIGVQLERLVDAVDNQDLETLAVLAGNMKVTALHAGVERIAQTAANLEKASEEDAEVRTVLKLTEELMHICRSTQHTYLNRVANGSKRPAADVAPGQRGL